MRHIQYGVAWHIGRRALACGAVGLPDSRQGQGAVGLFCSVSGWYTTPVARRAGLVLEHFPFTNAASQ